MQRQVSLASLDLSHERPVQTAGHSQAFLAQTKFVAAFTYPGAECSSGLGQRGGRGRHGS